MKFRKILVLSAAVLFSMQAFSCSKPVAGAASSSSSKTTAAKPGKDMEEDILFYVNKFRKSQGKPPLELNEVVSVEARDHSKAMASGKRGFGHDGFESRIGDVSKKIGQVSAAAENVAYGNLDAEGVVNGWIKSPGHRKNMLGNFNLIGIGAAQGKGNILYFTQIFVNKPAAKAASK